MQTINKRDVHARDSNDKTNKNIGPVVVDALLKLSCHLRFVKSNHIVLLLIHARFFRENSSKWPMTRSLCSNSCESDATSKSKSNDDVSKENFDERIYEFNKKNSLTMELQKLFMCLLLQCLRL